MALSNSKGTVNGPYRAELSVGPLPRAAPWAGGSGPTGRVPVEVELGWRPTPPMRRRQTRTNYRGGLSHANDQTWSTACPPSSMRPELAHEPKGRDPAQIDGAERVVGAGMDGIRNANGTKTEWKPGGSCAGSRRCGSARGFPAWEDGGRAVLQVTTARRGGTPSHRIDNQRIQAHAGRGAMRSPVARVRRHHKSETTTRAPRPATLSRRSAA